MGITKVFVALGAVSVLAISGCVNNVQKVDRLARCDHAQPQEFKVKISVKGASMNLKVNPESVVACEADIIHFEAGRGISSFEIVFENASPFGQNLKSSNSKASSAAMGKVSVKPRGEEEGFKYDVVAPGYITLDPWIRIRTR